MNTKEVVKPAVVLLLISAVAAACLGAVSEITKEPIALQNEKTLNESMQAVMPEASSFEQLTDAELTGTITAVYQADNGGYHNRTQRLRRRSKHYGWYRRGRRYHWSACNWSLRNTWSGRKIHRTRLL